MTALIGRSSSPALLLEASASCSVQMPIASLSFITTTQLQRSAEMRRATSRTVVDGAHVSMGRVIRREMGMA